ncbi:MAG: sulfatase-like hydrolase/transferase [Pseudomonadales bacterium]|nr:sulfatase-like hydrolase/transferase [Pseudomonadales bacterium]
MMRLRAALSVFGSVFLLALLGVSDPILQMINASPDIYSVYSLRSSQVLSVIGLLCVGIPAALGLLALLHRYVRDALTLVLVSLVLMSALHDLSAWIGGWLVVVASLLGGGGILWLIRTELLSRSFLAVCSLVVVFYAYQAIQASGYFLAEEEDHASFDLRTIDKAKGLRNVLLMVFDELPLTTLLDEAGELDGRRFPNLASLGEVATWYRGASSVSCNTVTAVPSILVGRMAKYPHPTNVSPTLANYPMNLFTLLADSHEIRALEPVTSLCPQRVCRQRHAGADSYRLLAEHLALAFLHGIFPDAWRDALPELKAYWIQAGTLHAGGMETENRRARSTIDERAGRLLSFVAHLVTLPSPWVGFAHVLLPHSPFNYVADGAGYFEGGATYGLENGVWTGPEEHINQNYYRHIQQSMFVDKLVGEIRAKLESAGVFDDMLLVIVADHGVAYGMGEPRRSTTGENFARLMGVPLLVKYPGQKEGNVSDEPVQTIDILPTVLAQLGKSLTRKKEMTGVTLGERSQPLASRGNFCLGETYDSYPVDLFDAEMDEVHRIRRSVAGDSRTRSAIPRYSSHPEWLGLRPDAVGAVVPARLTAYLAGFNPPEGVSPADFRPLHLNGQLYLGADERGDGRQIVVAVVNDGISAAVPVLDINGTRVISLFLDPASFRQGTNTIRLYLVVENEPFTFREVGLTGPGRPAAASWTYEVP